MTWELRFKASVEKDLARIAAKDQRRILDTLQQVLVDPRRQGKSLHGDKKELWCYRVGPYRILCDLQNGQLIVLVIQIGHRRDVYR